jgi:hypothetical protein
MLICSLYIRSGIGAAAVKVNGCAGPNRELDAATWAPSPVLAPAGPFPSIAF